MNKKLTLILLIVFVQNSISQNNFKKGYFIENDDKKVECLIKINPRINPSEFIYKLSENLDEQTKTISSAKEFGIYNLSKYLRATVNIDTSTDILANLTSKLEPNFKEQQLFLKILIEGKHSLYSYESTAVIRYFFSKENSEIKQLVYKRYKKVNEAKVGKNEAYKRQLWENFKCESISINDINKLDYKKAYLVNFFTIYNDCNNSESISFDKKEKKDLFNLTLRPGLNNSSLSLYQAITRKTTDFENKSGFRIGIETEFIINSIKDNKWSIFLEPTYQSYKSRTEWQNGSGQQTYYFIADYKSIEIPLGIRHYFYLNNSSKIFLNGAILMDIPLDSSIDFNFNPGHLDVETKFNFAFGVGYKLSDKYSMEIRSFTNRNLTSTYQGWKADYKTISVILGYTLF